MTCWRSLNSQLLTAAAIHDSLDGPPRVIIAKGPELFRRVEDTLRTVSKIELMLNPLEQDHQQLNAFMKEAIAQLRLPSAEHVARRNEAISRELIEVSQSILKRARVKRGEQFTIKPALTRHGL